MELGIITSFDHNNSIYTGSLFLSKANSKFKFLLSEINSLNSITWFSYSDCFKIIRDSINANTINFVPSPPLTSLFLSLNPVSQNSSYNININTGYLASTAFVLYTLLYS